MNVGRRDFLKGWQREPWAGVFKDRLLEVGTGNTEERGRVFNSCDISGPSHLCLRGCWIPPQMYLSWSPKVGQKSPGQKKLEEGPLVAVGGSHFPVGESEAQREGTIHA